MTADNRTPDEGWAELEALEREHARKAEEREQHLQKQLDDPLVQLGGEALVRDWTAHKSAEIAANLSAIDAAQVNRLALRLAEARPARPSTTTPTRRSGLSPSTTS